MTGQFPYGWVSGSGTFAFAQSSTGTGYSCTPVTLTAAGGRLTVSLWPEEGAEEETG